MRVVCADSRCRLGWWLRSERPHMPGVETMIDSVTTAQLRRAQQRIILILINVEGALHSV